MLLCGRFPDQAGADEMLAAAILAAGESRRMGTPKALLPYRGGTFVDHLIAVTRHSRVGVTRLILGAGADDIRKKLNVSPAEIDQLAFGLMIQSMTVTSTSMAPGIPRSISLTLVKN